VRQFLRQNFGEEAASEGNDILLRLFEQRKQMDATNPQAFRNTIQQCGAQLADALTYEQRLQLMAFLCGIAKADGSVSADEVEALREVARYMQMQQTEVDSLLGMGGSSLDDAYKVLEVSPDATDQEVRAAYRRLALKHHPDKVAMLGDDVKRAAEEKFQQINNAKERIYKARGMK
jgi:DnaJ like chaperone protein